MPPGLKEFLQRWTITTLAVLVAEHLVSGIHCENWRALLVATLVLGILNAILRPLLIVATVAIMGALNFLLGLRIALGTLPLQIGLFGFLLLGINAVLLLTVGRFVPGFHVHDFWAAFWGGVLIGIVTLFLNSFTRSGDARVVFRRGPDKPPNDKPGGGGGPVIDI
jgi:putative membrane protein